MRKIGLIHAALVIALATGFLSQVVRADNNEGLVTRNCDGQVKKAIVPAILRGRYVNTTDGSDLVVGRKFGSVTYGTLMFVPVGGQMNFPKYSPIFKAE